MASSRRIVPLATPVMRDVERTEQPSTSAEMTATFFAVLSLFISQAYYTALACQGNMTIEDRLIMNLSDILGIRLECLACGASTSASPEKWGEIPHNCHSCQVRWHVGNHETTYQAVNALRVALKGVRALEETKQIGYAVRLEVDRPKA